MEGIAERAARHGVPMLVEGPGSVFQTYLTEQPAVRNYREYAATDLATMARLHALLLERGVNIVPRGLWFLSTAHTAAQVQETLEVVDEALSRL